MQSLKITVPRTTQGDVLSSIAKSQGISRKALLRKLAIELANELPDVEIINQEIIQIFISAFPEESRNKIIRYSKSIKSSPSALFKRKIDDFIRQNYRQLDPHLL